MVWLSGITRVAPRQVFPPFSGELPSPLIVLDQEPNPDQEWFTNFSHAAGGKAEPGRDHVQAARSFGHDAEVSLLHRSQPKFVKLLQQTGSQQVRRADV